MTETIEEMRANFRKAAHYTNGLPVYPEGRVDQELRKSHLKIEREYNKDMADGDREDLYLVFIIIYGIGFGIWWLI